MHYQLNEKTAKTSQLCAWKASKKHVSPAPLSAINFSRPKKGSLPKPQKPVVRNRHYSCFDPTNRQHPISKEDLAELFEINKDAVVFTSLPVSEFAKAKAGGERCQVDVKEIVAYGSETDSCDENDENCIPEPLTALFDPTTINLANEELSEHGKKLYQHYVSTTFQNSYDNLCQVTKEQAASPTWMIHRAGRVTASICYRVSKMKDSKSLIDSIMQYKPSFTSRYTEYGKSMEKKSKEAFIREQSGLHEKFIFSESGLVVNADNSHLGASPDGLVSCACHGRAVLEIKCPYRYKDGFHGWQEDEKFPLTKDMFMKHDHQFYYQIQLQIDLCDAEFGYFDVYSPSEKQGILCPVGKNIEFMQSLKPVLIEKLMKFILPEIITRRNDVETTNERALICTCRRPKFGKMICCHNKVCSIGWYHYPCVNITREPRKIWLCKNCRDH